MRCKRAEQKSRSSVANTTSHSMRCPLSRAPMRLQLHLAAMLMVTCAYSAADPRCPSTGSNSQRLLIIHPPRYSTVALPLNITACVPQHLLRSDASASLLLTVNTAIYAESASLPTVTFLFDEQAKSTGIFKAEHPFEWCVYSVTADDGVRRLSGAYDCTLAAVSRDRPPPLILPLLSSSSQPAAAAGQQELMREQSMATCVHPPPAARVNLVTVTAGIIKITFRFGCNHNLSGRSSKAPSHPPPSPPCSAFCTTRAASMRRPGPPSQTPPQPPTSTPRPPPPPPHTSTSSSISTSALVRATAASCSSSPSLSRAWPSTPSGTCGGVGAAVVVIAYTSVLQLVPDGLQQRAQRHHCALNQPCNHRPVLRSRRRSRRCRRRLLHPIPRFIQVIGNILFFLNPISRFIQRASRARPRRQSRYPPRRRRHASPLLRHILRRRRPLRRRAFERHHGACARVA